MSTDRDATGTPEAELPEMGRQVSPPQPGLERNLLSFKLVPVVDRIRQIPVSLGLRQHRVFLVHGYWTGGEEGAGMLQIASRVEILPVPKVSGLGGLDEVLRATGVGEEGSVSVDRISAKYAEDDLRGLTPDLRDPNLQRTLARPMDFWWEIVEQRPQDPHPIIRRFNLAGVPELGRGRACWKVTLTKQDYDRGREGQVERGAF